MPSCVLFERMFYPSMPYRGPQRPSCWTLAQQEAPCLHLALPGTIPSPVFCINASYILLFTLAKATCIPNFILKTGRARYTHLYHTSYQKTPKLNAWIVFYFGTLFQLTPNTHLCLIKSPAADPRHIRRSLHACTWLWLATPPSTHSPPVLQIIAAASLASEYSSSKTQYQTTRASKYWT